jgi:uncharacterized protein YaiE (UPF0345 family)
MTREQLGSEEAYFRKWLPCDTIIAQVELPSSHEQKTPIYCDLVFRGSVRSISFQSASTAAAATAAAARSSKQQQAAAASSSSSCHSGSQRILLQEFEAARQHNQLYQY